MKLIKLMSANKLLYLATLVVLYVIAYSYLVIESDNRRELLYMGSVEVYVIYNLVQYRLKSRADFGLLSITSETNIILKIFYISSLLLILVAPFFQFW